MTTQLIFGVDGVTCEVSSSTIEDYLDARERVNRCERAVDIAIRNESDDDIERARSALARANDSLNALAGVLCK